MGKYDDILAGLPPPETSTQSTGKYDDILAGLPPANGGGKPPIGYVVSQVRKLAPWNRISQAMPEIAGAGAEKLGEMGVNPKVAAAAMLPVSMAPELTGAAAALSDMAPVSEGISKSPITKAIVNSPRDLSPEYDALHEAAGISKNLPETGGRTARFPNLAGQASKVPPPFAPAIAPTNYPRDPNAMLNFARSRMEALGDKLSPQELSDYRTVIGQLIDTGKVGGGQPMAMAAQLKAQATDLLNNRVEGLAELNKVYALSKKMRNPTLFLPQAIQGLIQKYGPWVARGAAGVLGGTGAYQATRKVLGE